MLGARRRWIGVALLGGALFVGCEDPATFSEPERRSQIIVDLEDVELLGQQQLVFRATVLPEPEMVHPHFEGRWTFADNEKPIDFYVIPAADYIQGQLPPAQTGIFWSSVQNAVVGQQRATGMHLHPAPGDWVIVLFNALPFGPTTRARFSSEVDLTFFK
jgi:hypothetical protein